MCSSSCPPLLIRTDGDGVAPENTCVCGLLGVLNRTLNRCILCALRRVQRFAELLSLVYLACAVGQCACAWLFYSLKPSSEGPKWRIQLAHLDPNGVIERWL